MVTLDSCPSSLASAIVVSTHFDDAVLSCFGALGPGVLVLTVLGGSPPEGFLGRWDADTGATDSRARVRERRAEDRRALAIAGSEPEHLDFPDGQYWRASGLRGLIRRAGVRAPTVETLAEVLRSCLPMRADVYAPAGIGNRTHVLVRDAVLSIRPDASLYADLPYALTQGFSEPPVRSGARRQRDVILDESAIRRKVEAVRCYATQLPELVVRFGDFIESGALAREVLWEVDG